MIRTDENTVRVTVQMAGKADQTFTFENKPKVEEVLRMAWLQATAECWVWPDQCNPNDLLENNDCLLVVAKTITQG